MIRIRLSPSALYEESALLSTDEQSRASRFVFEVHRRRFAATRSALRLILAAYLGVRAPRIAFAYSDRGRPSLAVPPEPPLDFNLSHADDLALLALSRGPVGVDLERVRSLPDAATIAQRFFSAEEAARLGRLRPELRPDSFFRAWTRKEALLKASGLGLGALGEVEVSLEANQAPSVRAAPGGCGSWRLFHLEPAASFVAAVAVEASVTAMRCSEWYWPVERSEPRPSV